MSPSDAVNLSGIAGYKAIPLKLAVLVTPSNVPETPVLINLPCVPASISGLQIFVLPLAHALAGASDPDWYPHCWNLNGP